MEIADLDHGDLTARIEEARHVAADAPDARSLHDLGVLLLKSYECYGGPALVSEAVRILRQAVEVSLAAGTGWNGPRGVLGAALVVQYELEGDPAALDEAIDLLSAVVRETPGDSVSGTDYRIELGVALEARVWETGSAQDADAAVELARSALADTPGDTVDQLVVRSNLSNALLTRYEVAGGPGHVAEAVTHARTVADAFPQTDPRRASMFTNLSSALQAAFGESGKITDLSDAVDAARLGVRFAVASDPGLSGYLVNLANGLFCLSDVRGDSGLVDEAVAAARRSVAECAPDAARRAVPLTCLGNSLRCRYELTGELAVLDEAIAADRAALDATSSQDPHHATCLSNLALSLTLRHEHEPDLGMLDAALGYARTAVTAARDGTPDRYSSLLTLGRAEYIKFLATADRDALDRCIEADREARGESEDSPGRAQVLANLAASLIVRGEQFAGAAGEPDAGKSHGPEPGGADLEEAASLLKQAIGLTPAGSPDRALYLYNLGEVRARIARAGGGPVREAIVAFRAAATVETASPMLRAEAAMEWGRLSASDGDWRAAAVGFGLAVGLFPLISPRQFGRDDQEHRLATFAGLASDAAACTLAASEPGAQGDRDRLRAQDQPGLPDDSIKLDHAGVQRAVTLLEQGRAVLVGHLLGDSADLTRVRAVAPELAAEFERLRDEFDSLGAGQLTGRLTSARAVAAGMPEPPDPAIRRRNLLRSRDAVVEKIRALDGLEHFQRAPDARQLLAAGAAGPFVMVNVSRYRCDAIIICDGGVRVVRLPGVTASGVADVTATYLRLFDELRRMDELSLAQRRRASNALREICGWLWDLIVRPVLEGLELPRRDGEVPRIWWCPTGSLALLPLHAACRYDPERGADVGVVDWAVSSYAVSARTLLALRGRTRVAVAGESPLVVAMDRTPGLPALPQVAREVAVIGTAVIPAPRILRNEAATRDAVRAGLARHPWFHFAGHSYQDLLYPARAGLCLGDGDLSALAIATQRLAGGELAYLSSCEGAVPGTQVPDEPLHLALAFQIAGYRNVIATLWSVSDLGAAKVTQAIYRRLARDGPIDADGTARALRAVILELRDRYPHEIWAAYLHAGV
jgi:tetratricopeptide (TPR) repeat protein